MISRQGILYLGEKIETFTLKQYPGNPHLTLKINESYPKIYHDIKEFRLPSKRLKNDDIFIFIRDIFSFESIFVKRGKYDIYEKMAEVRSARPNHLVYGHTYPQLPTIQIQYEKILSQLFIPQECCVLYDRNLIELFDMSITAVGQSEN